MTSGGGGQFWTPIPPLGGQYSTPINKRGVDACHETVRYWWNRFGPLFATEMRTRRIHHGPYSNWRWHLDEVFVRINGETCYLWRAVDHEGEVLEVFAMKRRDRWAALEFLKRTMKRYGRPTSMVTDRRQSYRAAMNVIGNEGCRENRRWLNNRAENSHQPFRRREGAMVRFRDIKTYRNSPLSMPRPTTISTTAIFSNKPERWLWLSGVNLQPKSPRLWVTHVRPS